MSQDGKCQEFFGKKRRSQGLKKKNSRAYFKTIYTLTFQESGMRRSQLFFSFVRVPLLDRFSKHFSYVYVKSFQRVFIYGSFKGSLDTTLNQGSRYFTPRLSNKKKEGEYTKMMQ
uniref:Uncharacterized protein n=1 Tax=Cacopsylla melanoneura TaxID=428564 RepID=A0A8D8R731_9HEMI